MNVLAFDPGSSLIGYALVHSEGARVRFLRAGRVESSASVVRALVADLQGYCVDRDDDGLFMGVEQPSGFIYEKQRGAQVVATARVAGGLVWLLGMLGYDVFEVPAPTVRKVVVGKASLGPKAKQGDMDRAIKAALPNFVTNLPRQTNDHTRDALALAVAANWMWLSSQRRTA